MAKLATTRMSSKGQVVIPEEIRNRLGLKTGVRFVVMGERDVVILKTLSTPSLDEFKYLVSEARAAASKGGMKRSDIPKAIKKVRKDK